MKILSTFALLVLLLTGCTSTDTSNSDNVKQTEVWQNYWVEYNEAGDELTAGCTFRFGGSTGTTLALTNPANVTFEGNALTASTGVLIKGVIGGTHYGYDGKGYKPEYTFKYINNDSKAFINSIGITKFEVDSVPEVLDAQKTNIFVFKTLAEADGEHFEVEIRNDKNDYVVNAPVIKGNRVEVSGDIMPELGNGMATVLFRKQKNTGLKQAGHLGGAISMTYTSKAYRVKIINVDKVNKSNDKFTDTVQTLDN
ncbi:MAG: hypothetical protein M0D57_04845 [Sphingobacteriales bacterium JAD_PAG50586_3]|nr:MAG: hypothetical protein M0D57_04845 [Sphingobacteriales bacterium JAD_PAG50586_3]